MIPTDTHVFLAAQPVDFRKGPDGFFPGAGLLGLARQRSYGRLLKIRIVSKL
jgi:hypothetical protein